jgi:hypothetical protein
MDRDVDDDFVWEDGAKPAILLADKKRVTRVKNNFMVSVEKKEGMNRKVIFR